MTTEKNNITGVILAGGLARRMEGQDKGLIELGEKPMIEYIINLLEPQVENILINANRNLEQYNKYNYSVIKDNIPDYCGPLAGIAAALENTETDYMVSVPCDSPFIPLDLVNRLKTRLDEEQAEISVAHSNERLQPVFCMINKTLLSSLQKYLEQGERKIDRWFEQHKLAVTDFSDIPDAFDNINTPEDIEAAISKLKQNA